mgnify:CR=1 FL=1
MAIKVRVNNQNSLRVKAKSQENLRVKSSIVTTGLSQLSDVDLSSLDDGSVLVYSTNSGKWESTLLLEKQTVECGQY